MTACPDCEHPYEDAEWMYEQYVLKRKSSRDIAAEIGTNKNKVLQWLKKHGIEARDPQRAMLIARSTEPANFRTRGDGYEEWRHAWKGEQWHVYVHRLLAVAEFGFCAVKGNHVHHKNGVRWDNRPDNLELLEKGEHHRLHNQGENQVNSVLTEEDVREIRHLYWVKEFTLTQIADKYGVNTGTVYNAVHGRTWKHVADESGVMAQ